MKFFLPTIVLFCFLLIPPTCQALVPNPISYSIKQTVTIGESKLVLYGYSGPYSKVVLQATALNEQTVARADGYFEFDQILLPKLAENPELCLFSSDTDNINSFPTCIPPLPQGPFNFEIGPVLLAPTIQMDKGSYQPDQQIKAQGQTIPGATVEINLANTMSDIRSEKWEMGNERYEMRSETWEMGNEKEEVGYFDNLKKLPVSNTQKLTLQFLKSLTSHLSPLIATAQAYSLPKYQASADSSGHYEFNLPIEQNQWQVYATAKYQGSPTPKSNSLSFKVLTPLQIYVTSTQEWLWGYFRYFLPDYWLLIILLEIILIILLLIIHRRNKKREKFLLAKIRILEKKEYRSNGHKKYESNESYKVYSH